MANFERITTVGVPPDVAFGYLSDPRRLPDYVGTMTYAGSDAEAGELDADADAQGRHGPGEARFFADPASRRVEWGRTGTDYAGSITVAEGDTSGSAQVTIRLRTRADSDGPQVDRMLDETVRNLQQRLSGR